MEQLKVGDSVRVFEVVNAIYEPNQKGRHVCEALTEFFGCEYGVDLVPILDIDKYGHYGIDKRNDAKCVGRLIIKILK